MNRLLSVLLLVLLAPSANGFEVDVRAFVRHAEPLWVGQRLELVVELRTDAVRFGQQRIRLPSVPGAMILEDSMLSTTINERIDGKDWQIQSLRYPMFIQRPGTIEVGEIRAEFGVYESFTGDPEPVARTASAFSLSATLPPGAADPRMLITTDNMSVRVALSSEPESYIVGDAVTQTITRVANDVSGMAFTPLPPANLSGIASYPKPPEISDKQNRGTLTSTRIDATTYVFERAGEYEIPAIDLQWWNPETEQLSTETIPAVQIVVLENPAVLAAAAEAVAEAEAAVERTERRKLLATVLLAAAALLLALRRFGPFLASEWRRRREIRQNSEATWFATLQRACNANQPTEAYNAYNRWRQRAPDVDTNADAALKAELAGMQRAIIGVDTNWQGRALATALRRVRRSSSAQRSTRRQMPVLPSLNP